MPGTSLRGYVARRKAAAAAGQHEVGFEVLDRVEQGARNEGAVVFHHDAFEAGPAAFGDERLERRARGIGLERARVGAGDDGEGGAGLPIFFSHGFLFP